MAALGPEFDSDRKWDPGPLTPDEGRRSLRGAWSGPRLRPVIAPKGSGDEIKYQRYLEERVPPPLHGQLHWACKSLSSYELLQLGEAILGAEAPPARFVDCCKQDGFAGAMQTAAVAKMANASAEEVRQFATSWHALLGEGTPEGLYLVALDIQVLAKHAVEQDGHLFSFADLPLDESPATVPAARTAAASQKSWWQFWK